MQFWLQRARDVRIRGFISQTRVKGIERMITKTMRLRMMLVGAGLLASATLAWAAASCFFDGSRCPVSGGKCNCANVSQGKKCDCD